MHFSNVIHKPTFYILPVVSTTPINSAPEGQKTTTTFTVKNEAHGRTRNLCFYDDPETSIKTAQAICRSLDLGDAQSVTKGGYTSADNLSELRCNQHGLSNVDARHCNIRKTHLRSCQQMKISCLKNALLGYKNPPCRTNFC